MDGEHGIGRRFDARLPDAEPRKLRERAMVAHGDELHAIHDMTRERAGEAPANRADALCVEHDGRLHDEREEDDAEIVVEAPAARDILQQAAAARDQEIGAPEQLQDMRDIQPGDSVNAVPRSRIFRIRRNDRDMKFWVQVG